MVVKEYQYGNATIIVTRPELSDKELKKQEERILIALQQYGKEIKEQEQWQQ